MIRRDSCQREQAICFLALFLLSAEIFIPKTLKLGNKTTPMLSLLMQQMILKLVLF